MALTLKPDAKLRKAWFVDDAMSHPAKGHLGLWWEILERYTQTGQWVLDPMAGIGSTLMGCLMGRNVICNEMETHFLEPMAASWAKMQTVGPMLGYQMGQAVILRGDARMLPLQSADAIVTSPPWEDQLGNHVAAHHKTDFSKVGGIGHKPGGRGPGPNSYTRPVSAVVTSPPYEDQTTGHDPGWRAPHDSKGTLAGATYTRPVDAVVTSPPYEQSLSPNVHGNDVMPAEGFKGGWEAAQRIRNGYSTAVENIGNLRGNRYWEAMEAVYRECHRVLIPGGIMALVVKGYTRDKKYVDLPQQTADLIETLGFQVFDRWEREVPLSFWRTLQKQNGNWDEALRYEHIVVGRKL